MTFYVFDLDNSKVKKLNTPPKDVKNGQTPVWVVPYSEKDYEVFRELREKYGFKKIPPVMIDTAIVGTGKKRTYYVLIKKERGLSDQEAIRMAMINKRDEFISTVMKCVVANNQKSVEKEFKEFLKKNGIQGFSKNTSYSWSIVSLANRVAVKYPKNLSKQEAIAYVLYDENIRRFILENVRKFKREAEKNGIIRLYGDGVIYFRGEYFDAYYRKGRAGVRIDTRAKRIVLGGKTVSEAKKYFLTKMHREVLSEAKQLVNDFTAKFGDELGLEKITLSKEPPTPHSSRVRYVPFGQTRVKFVRVGFLRAPKSFEIRLRPELFLLEDWKRKYIVVHELAHVKSMCERPYIAEEHDKYFYENLEGIAKAIAPDVARKVKKFPKNVKEENKLIGHDRITDDSIRKLKLKKV